MFACDGPTTLAASFGIERDVILDAEDQLTVDGFAVSQGVTAELHGFRMRPQEGAGPEDRASTHNSGTLLIANSSISGFAGGIVNRGTLMVRESILSGNPGGGIGNLGTLTLTDSEISGNGTGGFGLAANDGAGIHNDHGIVTVANSTLSANLSNGTGGGIYNKGGSVTLTNCTLSGNEASNGAAVFNTGVLTLTRTTVADNTAFEGSSIHNVGVATATNTIIEGDCGGMTALASGNHNIESPADTCGLPGRDDQSGVTAEALNLGPLADNGGSTLTHKPGDGGLGEGSFAIDAIPEKDCAVDTDQRGEPRPETGGTMCDVGAVEVQP
jgi:hypothetical protein